MGENRVSIFFQGHDHLFAKEVINGIVSQDCPMPSDAADIVSSEKDEISAHLNITANQENSIIIATSAATTDCSGTVESRRCLSLTPQAFGIQTITSRLTRRKAWTRHFLPGTRGH